MDNSSLEDVRAVRKARRQKNIAQVKRYWLTLAFFLGFIVDNITLNRVDELLDNVILATQVTLSMVSILILYAGVSGKLSGKFAIYSRKYAPMVVQYSFGGLLSGMLIFYGRSGDWVASWPFLMVILLAIIGNEVVKERSSRLVYNLAILFIGLLSYLVLVIPVVTGKMGPIVFVLSGLVAACIMYGFIRILYQIIPRFIDIQIRAVVFTLGVIFGIFNIFYFTNIIPPIPLSLKDLGIYHNVVHLKDDGLYQLTWVEKPWYAPLRSDDRTIYTKNSNSAFCFASVFAPTKINTDIYHRWEYLDDKGNWQFYERIPYSIAGGSSRGYRGYTYITSTRTGKWRCLVETQRGQVLGRTTFTISNEAPPRGLQVTRQ
ncbi:DUF2914 domain-containing protein [Candidatus Kaiserbacteria bacterium]|nr:DUF2914 domain-containing protein [Candidatus Kaiserbacteria bacterium]